MQSLSPHRTRGPRRLSHMCTQCRQADQGPCVPMLCPRETSQAHQWLRQDTSVEAKMTPRGGRQGRGGSSPSPWTLLSKACGLSCVRDRPAQPLGPETQPTLTVEAAGAASLCRCHDTLAGPLQHGPSWPRTRGEQGGEREGRGEGRGRKEKCSDVSSAGWRVYPGRTSKHLPQATSCRGPPGGAPHVRQTQPHIAPPARHPAPDWLPL